MASAGSQSRLQQQLEEKIGAFRGVQKGETKRMEEREGKTQKKEGTEAMALTVGGPVDAQRRKAASRGGKSTRSSSTSRKWCSK
eukprot:scaffold102_cov340-Pavlova_lutheri.AAC.72